MDSYLAQLKELQKSLNTMCFLQGFTLLGVITIAVLLSGCGTTAEQRAERDAAYIQRNFGPTCEKMGAKTGSAEHRECMLKLYAAEQSQYGRR